MGHGRGRGQSVAHQANYISEEDLRGIQECYDTASVDVVHKITQELGNNLQEQSKKGHSLPVKFSGSNSNQITKLDETREILQYRQTHVLLDCSVDIIC